MRVTALRSSPVKGFPQRTCEVLELDAAGIRDDRRFVILDPDDRVLYGADLPEFMGADASFDGAVLDLRFADGAVVSAPVTAGGETIVRASGGRTLPARLLDGPFAGELSERAGRPLRLAAVPVGRGAPGPVTIISEATIARLAGELGVPELDHRRFKMSITVNGCDAHGEDAWSGGTVRVGDAVLQVGGPVPRCVLTTRDPDTGRRDLDTLRAILAYRPPTAKGEPPLGVYAAVVTPAPIRVGDAISVV